MTFTNDEKNQTDNLEKEQSEVNEDNNDTASQDATNDNSNDKEADMAEKTEALQENPGQENDEVTTTMIMGIEENFSGNNDFNPLGVDKTTVGVIVKGNLDVWNTDPKNLNDWFKLTEKPKDIEPEEIPALISGGLSIMVGMASETNIVRNLARKTIAEKSIPIGEVCIRLQKLRNGAKDGIPWGVWADDNIPLGTRTRQKYMLIAANPDCHEFTYLGVDKMVALCSIIKGKNSKGNAIKAIMRKYKIPLDPDNNITVEKFKLLIDAMIAAEKLLKRGYRISFDLIKEAVKDGVKLNDTLIKELAKIKNSGGKPAQHLQNLIDGKDGGSDEKDPESNIKDVNSSAEQFIKSLFYVLEDISQEENGDLIKTVDWPIVDEVIDALEKLRAKRPSA